MPSFLIAIIPVLSIIMIVFTTNSMLALFDSITLAILFGVMGLTHKQAYKYVFMVSALLPLVTALLAISLTFVGIL